MAFASKGNDLLSYQDHSNYLVSTIDRYAEPCRRPRYPLELGNFPSLDAMAEGIEAPAPWQLDTKGSAPGGVLGVQYVL